MQANYFKKYLAENAVNTISEPLDFKIFWGGDAPRHPDKLAPPALIFSPPTYKYAPLSLVIIWDYTKVSKFLFHLYLAVPL